MKTKKYHNPTAFHDLLFNCLLGFVFLFVIAFLLIMPPIDDQQKKPKAEFLITLTWDSDTDDDVDLWIQNPAENIMFFRDKDTGLMHLDRDDIGRRRDLIYLQGQEIYQKINQEIATIRGFIPGEWIINIHMYAKRNTNPASINVRIDKLNPQFTTIAEKSYIMKNKGEEVTVLRLTMNSKGEITGQSDLFKSLAETKLIETGGGG